MTENLKKVLTETAKELTPLLEQLPKDDGKNNYITYYKILSNIDTEDKRKFTALALMYCENTNKEGIINAMDIISG